MMMSEIIVTQFANKLEQALPMGYTISTKGTSALNGSSFHFHEIVYLEQLPEYCVLYQ
jgi:hypothetical protein